MAPPETMHRNCIGVFVSDQVGSPPTPPEFALKIQELFTAGSPKFQGGIKSRVPLVAKKVMKILVLGKSDQGQSCSEFHAEFGGFCLFLS